MTNRKRKPHKKVVYEKQYLFRNRHFNMQIKSHMSTYFTSIPTILIYELYSYCCNNTQEIAERRMKHGQEIILTNIE